MTIPGARELPEDIDQRYHAWLRMAKWWNRIHYILGIVGVLVSAAAAAFPEQARWLALISTGCLGVIGFANPQRHYLKLIRAWRALDRAVLRYRHDQDFTVDDLIVAVDRGEELITEFEDRELESQLTRSARTRRTRPRP